MEYLASIRVGGSLVVTVALMQLLVAYWSGKLQLNTIFIFPFLPAVMGVIAAMVIVLPVNFGLVFFGKQGMNQSLLESWLVLSATAGVLTWGAISPVSWWDRFVSGKGFIISI